MKRTPPLPFSPPPPLPHSLSGKAGGFTIAPALLPLKTHCSYCAATECNVSGVTVKSVRGCGLMVFDRQYPQCSSPSPGGPNRDRRGTRMNHSYSSVQLLARAALTVMWPLQNLSDILVYNNYSMGFCDICICMSALQAFRCFCLHLLFFTIDK